jgi:hypothetical protein
MIRIAILDDYQNVSLEMADWSPIAGNDAGDQLGRASANAPLQKAAGW